MKPLKLKDEPTPKAVVESALRTIETLKTDLPATSTSKQQTAHARQQRSFQYYMASYPALCRTANILLQTPTNDTAYALCNLAYGWMPTAVQHDFSPNSGFTVETLKSIANADSSEIASQILEQLDRNHAPFNKSWVGSSKVFHFINPSIFPIWDSKIAQKFGLFNRDQYNTRAKYRAYLIFLNAWSHSPEIHGFQTFIRQESEQEVTAIRAAELALFLCDPPSP